MDETMDWAEQTALRILSEHNGSELFTPFVTALRAAREEERKRCLRIAGQAERPLEDYSGLTLSGTGRDHYLFARGWDAACDAMLRAIESGDEPGGERAGRDEPG